MAGQKSHLREYHEVWEMSNHLSDLGSADPRALDK